MHGSEPEGRYWILSDQGGVQKMVLAKISADTSEQNRSSKWNVKGTGPIPYNQQIENGWASGIQEPTNKKSQAGVIVVKESCWKVGWQSRVVDCRMCKHRR